MTQDRWRQIQGIFEAASTLEGRDREAYLDASCAEDPLLREEVVSLLRAGDEYGPFDAMASRFAASLSSSRAEDPEAGARIGPYRLLRKIGEGGMGVVYQVERADGQFEQQAALKLVRRGAGASPLLHRFLNERQILARLVHPNIARLYDGGFIRPAPGEPDDGRPYFVMEYVEGTSIDDYCDAHRLDVNARLELFCHVCDAVGYAHRNLVVHRDLKPSNILVTGGGEVKLLDFGVAKLLETASESDSATLTQIGLRAMTPEYASPEQVRRAPITTATDVYALGIILYELLSGHRPYRVETLSPGAMERVICEVEPQLPSTMVNREVDTPHEEAGLTPDEIGRARASSGETLRRRLAGDLDTIVMKALRKEPERRYASAEQFRDDVRRHLQGHPVLARPSTTTYRISKFVRRHRLGAAAAVLIAVSLVTGMIGTTWQARIAADERDHARVEAEKAEQVAAFLEDLFNASDPLTASETERPDTLQLREFLARGAKRVRRDLSAQPAVQARMLNVVGNVYHSLGLYDEAVPLLEESLRIRRASLGPDHPDVAESLHGLAAALHRKDEFDASHARFEEALAISAGSAEARDASRARVLVDFALLLRDEGDFDEADRLLQEALDIQRERFGNEHIDVATTLMHLGTVFHYRSDLDPAESYYLEALALHRKLLSEGHPTLAESLLNTGTFLREKGNVEAAEPLLQEALSVRRRVLGDEHPLTVTAIYELAMLFREKKDYAEAASLFSKVIDLDRNLLGPDHHYVGMDLYELGITLSRMEDYDGAEKAYREALAVVRKTLPYDHPMTANILNGLGFNFVRKGAPAEGEPMLREALQIFRRQVGDEGWRTGMAESTLGHALLLQGRFEEAEPLLFDGFSALRDNSGPTRTALERLVLFYEMQNRAEQAAEYRAMLAQATH